VDLSDRAINDLASPKDTIFARKIVMGAIDMNMDEIETMLAPEGKLNLADAQEHADTISIMLMAIPHMFPASTNQWAPNVARDPAMDTYAAPELWTNFADFYRRAERPRRLRQKPLVPKGRRIAGPGLASCERRAIPATRSTKILIDQRLLRGATLSSF
jgi:hypothetical protein